MIRIKNGEVLFIKSGKVISKISKKKNIVPEKKEIKKS